MVKRLKTENIERTAFEGRGCNMKRLQDGNRLTGREGSGAGDPGNCGRVEEHLECEEVHVHQHLSNIQTHPVSFN